MKTVATDYDVIVVGAGFGGLYGVYRFREDGLAVLGLEAAGGVGGVWYHNRYPGSRVDVDSFDYCYYFSPEVYRDWKWTERYATQPELLRYLNYVADRYHLKSHIKLNTRLTGAEWDPQTARYRLSTSAGDQFTCRFLVMATGNLSAARDPEFPGLRSFRGEWVQASRWPDRPVTLEGRRVGIIGTGSSGVQAAVSIAEKAEHLCVFQRSPNFAVPARNGPLNEELWNEIRARVPEVRAQLFKHPLASHLQVARIRASECTGEEVKALIEAAWARGGHHMNAIFRDQTTRQEANDLVAEFIRAKIRETVSDPVLAEKLCPYDHPLGARRLCVADGYFEIFNRANVTLVDINADPIERMTETGIQTSTSHYELDLIVFALGFHAFTGAIDDANIRNAEGQSPTDRWGRGPRTLLGLMTVGFPNFFMVTGPGSPSVTANMAVHNEYHIDWIADCITYLRDHGKSTIEPTLEGEASWTQHVVDVSRKLLRRGFRNYMVHVNEDDGSRLFIPYGAGMRRYGEHVRAIVEDGYRGFRLA